jgi:DNA-nicking Smr family endonuclease
MKLKRGQLDIEARLDLHGMNRVQAYDSLKKFILSSHKKGLRHVLVITGKGQRSRNFDEDARAKGVLRQAVPMWLSEGAMGEIVLKWSCARPRDGGEGALYILLRRQRPRHS